MSLPPVILASVSPRRAELLRQLVFAFEIVPSEMSEVHSEQLTAREMCQVNAYRKARSVAKRFPDALVVGADTLVCLGHRVLGKPADRLEAESMLTALQGRDHEVVTGVCLVHLRGHRQLVFAESTVVRFRRLGLLDVRRYLDLVNPLDKAGAYAIQEHGDLLVEQVSGSYLNVVGLPVERLKRELESWA